MARPNFNSNGTSKDDVPKVKFSLENIKHSAWFFAYLKPYRWSFISGLILISLSGFTTMAFPFLLMEMLKSITHDASGYLGAFSPSAIAFILIGVLSIQMVFSFFRVFLFSKVGESAVADLRKAIFKHLIEMHMDFHAQNRVGELSSRISADVSQIQDAVTTVLAELLRGIVVITIGISMIVILSPKLSLLMLGIVPVLAIGTVLFSRTIRKRSKETQDQLAQSSIIVQESLQGVSNVKAFTNEEFETKRYSTSLQDVVSMAIKGASLRGTFVSVFIFTLFSIIVFFVWYGSQLMSISELTTFVLYMGFVGGSMVGFAELFTQLQKTLGATSRIKEILNTPTEFANQLNQEFLPTKISGNIEFRDVEFAYPSRPEITILKGISFSLQHGQQYALVGTSGAGKSTISSLLLGFYHPQAGSILLEGLDFQKWNLKQIRKSIAYVPQDILLFGGSIFDNIAYGKPEATYDEIIQAAKKAYAHDFITAFPEKYDTIVGERGIKLSGGQRQRIAIARAILKNPAILILDEATSSLDSESERWVQKALEELMKDRTSIVIAHRLSTIRNANRIFVLNEGTIAEEGTHEELIHLENGIYGNLLRMQQYEQPV